MFKYLLILLLTSCIESNNCPASTEKQINSNSVARAEINCVKPETYSIDSIEYYRCVISSIKDELK